MATRQDAVAQVDGHVEPKACFVTQDSGSSTSWRPLGGTGCAHWVAHQLGIKRGAKGSNACMDGYTLRVPALVTGMTVVTLRDVAEQDVWTNAGKTHTGLVVKVQKDDDGKVLDLTIKHCSSGQGAVVENSWNAYFSGQGQFFRHLASTAATANGSSAAGRRSTFPEQRAFG